ncbi:MAG TPA: SIR2 family protein [Pyrinomonadaceae bacterium]|nr:SIR2 family protein [Pyrinomonadaceae bacterium]
MSNAELLNSMQPDGWRDEDWQALLLAVEFKDCTPFLGAGACAGVLPLGGEVARALAREFNYPFPDDYNLVRVAQYVAVQSSPKMPKYRIAQMFRGKGPPDFNNPSEPHAVVADLRLPVYVTTNYDDFMTQALLRRVRPEKLSRLVCNWYAAHSRRPPAPPEDPDPTEDAPLVFHLHGTLDNLESMVLTEDDYLDFLMYISEEQRLIPPRVERAFASSSLLFMGYSLEDMNFKVLFRKLAGYMQRNEGTRHVSVQLAPRVPGAGGTGEGDGPPLSEEEAARLVERAQRQRAYLEKHFGIQRVKVYWGTCEDFACDLRRRWEAQQSGR